MKTRAALIFTMAIVTSGCAQGRLTALPTVDDPSKAAEIIVIRPRGVLGCSFMVKVLVDDRETYGLGCGEHAAFLVPQGERIFGVDSLGTPRRVVTTDVQAGRRYYFHIDSSAGMGYFLNRVTAETGERLMAETSRLR